MVVACGEEFDAILKDPTARVLDLCCGTGDMAFALQRRAREGARIVGADFAHPCCTGAAVKSAKMAKRPVWIESDALQCRSRTLRSAW